MTVNSMFPTCFNPGNLLLSFQTNFYQIISWKPAIFHSVQVSTQAQCRSCYPPSQVQIHTLRCCLPAVTHDSTGLMCVHFNSLTTPPHARARMFIRLFIVNVMGAGDLLLLTALFCSQLVSSVSQDLPTQLPLILNPRTRCSGKFVFFV